MGRRLKKPTCRRRSVLNVAVPLHGVRNGNVTGTKSFIAARLARQHPKAAEVADDQSRAGSRKDHPSLAEA